MRNRSWMLWTIVLLVVLASLIVIAACSQPTAGPSGGTAPAQGATAEDLDRGYPLPPTDVPTAIPEGYVPPALRTPTAEATP